MTLYSKDSTSNEPLIEEVPQRSNGSAEETNLKQQSQQKPSRSVSRQRSFNQMLASATRRRHGRRRSNTEGPKNKDNNHDVSITMAPTTVITTTTNPSATTNSTSSPVTSDNNNNNKKPLSRQRSLSDLVSRLTISFRSSSIASSSRRKPEKNKYTSNIQDYETCRLIGKKKKKMIGFFVHYYNNNP